MELRLMRESIPVEQPAGAGQSQAVVEGEMTLPGGLREEAHVLYAGGMAVVDSVETMQERASVMGRVVFHALYTQGDPDKVNAIEASAEFTHLMDLPGAVPRSQCQADVQVEHVEARVHNGRLSLRAILRLGAEALLPQQVEAMTGLSGVTGIEMKTQQMDTRRTVATGSGEVLLREELALPADLQIRETLCATAFPQVTEVTGGLGRLGLSGELQLEVVHASNMPGKPLVMTRHTLPFEQSMELVGEDGDMLSGCARVKDVAVVSQDMGDGECTLRAEVLLGLQGWAERKDTLTVLSDAYTTAGDALSLKRQEVTCRVDGRRMQAAESGKVMMMLPEGSPALRSALCGFVTPVLTGREQVGGRLTVDGMLEITLLYMSDDSSAPVTIFQEEPFHMTFAVQAEADDLMTLSADHVDLMAITSDRVEIKYIMHLNVSGVTAATVQMVTDAQCVPAEAPEGGIVLYFVQPGETLWDIARRYRVSERSIRQLNPELTGEPKTGQGIVVWYRETGQEK